MARSRKRSHHKHRKPVLIQVSKFLNSLGSARVLSVAVDSSALNSHAHVCELNLFSARAIINVFCFFSLQDEEAHISSERSSFEYILNILKRLHAYGKV